jgi:outer membrane protein assembly factor BamB
MKNCARGISMALLLSASIASADTLWRQYGFDSAHTSFNPSEQALSPLTVGRLALFWKSDTFKAVAASPTLGPGGVFVASDGRVHAFDKQTGARRWARLSCSGEGTQQPAFGRDLLLVGDGGGDLAAYRPANGKQVWCDDESGSIVSAPAVDGDSVFITNGVEAVAIDQATAFQHWRFNSADFVRLSTTPAILNGVVFVTGENSVFALDGITGRKLWRRNLGPQGNISSPSVANGVVYVGGTSLYALSAADGHLIWKNESVGVNVSTPAIANGRVFVNSQDPSFGLWAFDAANGAFLWRSELPGESLATVTVANGVVYDIAETGELMMFDAVHGTFLSSIKDPDGKPFNADFGSQPIVADGVVYVSTGDFSSPNRVDAFRLGP